MVEKVKGLPELERVFGEVRRFGGGRGLGHHLVIPGGERHQPPQIVAILAFENLLDVLGLNSAFGRFPDEPLGSRALGNI